ncbi:MAG: hypothetical protein TR69_WS6001000765 [candidate division WS6 bacterium OLB20]|uniref:Uncharacterized protein n=1 Tax=candidate division WS6 bacterium OLB20 TaxID=1617426 RepID=A0A136LYS7_9BACT|nr:MAG: hypothetical protein TR69_WS6001000765 [candidate division WS6 bacterium OLB20]
MNLNKKRHSPVTFFVVKGLDLLVSYEVKAVSKALD